MSAASPVECRCTAMHGQVTYIVPPAVETGESASKIQQFKIRILNLCYLAIPTLLGECSAWWGKPDKLQGALVFHKKYLGKRLGYQMFVMLGNVAWVCAHIGLYTLCCVSLITGVGYRVEQWGG